MWAMSIPAEDQLLNRCVFWLPAVLTLPLIAHAYCLSGSFSWWLPSSTGLKFSVPCTSSPSPTCTCELLAAALFLLPTCSLLALQVSDPLVQWHLGEAPDSGTWLSCPGSLLPSLAVIKTLLPTLISLLIHKILEAMSLEHPLVHQCWLAPSRSSANTCCASEPVFCHKVSPCQPVPSWWGTCSASIDLQVQLYVWMNSHCSALGPNFWKLDFQC